MAILKLKSATLMEALVASIIIFTIFVIAINIITNVALNTSKKNSFRLRQEVNEIEYKALTNQLSLPFTRKNENWYISVYKKNNQKIFELKNLNSGEINIKLLSDENY